MEITDWESDLQPELMVALCDIGERQLKGANCGYAPAQDWNQKCWKRRVSVGRKRLALTDDIAERLCDEIDHFTLVYQAESKAKNLWPIKQARSIAVFSTHCEDMKGLMANIAAVGALLDQLKVPRSTIRAGL